MKIELESLQISALRDFDVDQYIEMPQSEVVSVIGHNKDDGGSNGTGKSTFSMASVVNLYGPKEVGISSASLKNRHLSVPVRIIGGYRVDGIPLKVDRTVGGKLRYKHGDNDWKEGKGEDIQNEISSIIKLTSEQFKALSNKGQGDSSSFLLMKDSEKKEFLSSFFDLSFVETAKEQAQVQLKSCGEQASYMTAEVAGLTNSCRQFEIEYLKRKEEFDALYGAFFDHKIVAKRKESEPHQLYLEQINALLNDGQKLSDYVCALDSIQTAVKQLQTVTEFQYLTTVVSIENAQQELKTVTAALMIRPEVPPELVERNNRIEIELSTKRMNSRNAQDLLVKIQVLDASIKEKEHELSHLDGSICQSCGNTVKPESIQPTKDKFAAHIAVLKTNRDAISNQWSSIPLLTHEAEDALIQELRVIKDAIAKFLAENSQDSLKQRQASLAQTINSLGASIVSHNQSLEMAQNAVKVAIENGKAVLIGQKRELENQIAQIENTAQQMTKDRDLAASHVASWKASLTRDKNKLIDAQLNLIAKNDEVDTLTRVCGVTSNSGFIGYIFDRILEDLNSEINHNLKVIPNARRFSLQFTPDKVAKTTGEVSKSITYQLFNGNEQIEFNTLSGGEKLSVIISVDEALDTVLSRRLGVNLGWKFLDEQFSWIDENSKEAILEFYKTKAEKKAYFIVDHASEFNASLDRRIVIIKENNLARFANANDL